MPLAFIAFMAPRLHRMGQHNQIEYNLIYLNIQIIVMTRHKKGKNTAVDAKRKRPLDTLRLHKYWRRSRGAPDAIRTHTGVLHMLRRLHIDIHIYTCWFVLFK